MARVEIPITYLPLGNVVGANVGIINYVDGDNALDHVISNPQPGDIIGGQNKTSGATNRQLVSYTNRYGRPSSPPGTDLGGAVTQVGSMTFVYLTNLDGFVSPTGTLEVNISTDNITMYCIRTGGVG